MFDNQEEKDKAIEQAKATLAEVEAGEVKTPEETAETTTE